MNDTIFLISFVLKVQRVLVVVIVDLEWIVDDLKWIHLPFFADLQENKYSKFTHFSDGRGNNFKVVNKNLVFTFATSSRAAARQFSPVFALVSNKDRPRNVYGYERFGMDYSVQK